MGSDSYLGASVWASCSSVPTATTALSEWSLGSNTGYVIRKCAPNPCLSPQEPCSWARASPRAAWSRRHRSKIQPAVCPFRPKRVLRVPEVSECGATLFRFLLKLAIDHNRVDTDP
jgi:hypothetical protein